MTERRRHPRVRLNSEFAVATDGHLAFVEDLSLSGALIRTRTRLDEGSEVELRASLVLDDVYVLQVRARVIGYRMARGVLALEFCDVSPEMRTCIERAIAFAQVRHQLSSGAPQALAAWQALQSPAPPQALFDDKVLAQPNLLAQAAQADRRSLRQFLRTHRAQAMNGTAHAPSPAHAEALPSNGAPSKSRVSSPSRISTRAAVNTSSSRVPADTTTPAHVTSPLASSISANLNHSPSASSASSGSAALPSPPRAADSAASVASASTSGPRRVPGQAVASSHPRAKTAKPNGTTPSHPRTTTLSIPITASEVEAWEASLIPVMDEEPPARPDRSSSSALPAVIQAPRSDKRSDDEVTRVFAVASQSDRTKPRGREHETPIPAHLKLPSPEEDFI